MDQMTQQNAALVEESAAASRTLQDEAQAMYDRMSAYSIADGQKPEQKKPAPKPAAQKPAGRQAARTLSASPSKFGNGRQHMALHGAAKAPAPASQSDMDWQEF